MRDNPAYRAVVMLATSYGVEPNGKDCDSFSDWQFRENNGCLLAEATRQHASICGPKILKNLAELKRAVIAQAKESGLAKEAEVLETNLLLRPQARQGSTVPQQIPAYPTPTAGTSRGRV